MRVPFHTMTDFETNKFTVMSETDDTQTDTTTMGLKVRNTMGVNQS